MTRRCYLYELRKRGVPFYIGITTNPKTRQQAHRRRFGRRVSLHPLVIGSIGYCKDLEHKLIVSRREKYDLANRSDGGQWLGQHWIGMKHRESTKKKMSEIGKRNWRDPKFRARMKKAMAKRPPHRRGYTHPEHLKRMWSEQKRAFWADPKNKRKMHKACLGRTQTEATREKIRAAALLRWQDPNYRKIGLQAAAIARAAKEGVSHR